MAESSKFNSLDAAVHALRSLIRSNALRSLIRSDVRPSELFKRYGGWLAGCLVAVPGFFAIVSLEPGSAPAVALFIGRFHPSLVHFPIGFLLLAALIEAVAWRYEGFRSVRAAVPFVLALAAAAALTAVIAGYLLSLESSYQEGSVDWHMWLGFGVAAGACSAFFLERLASRKKSLVNAYRGVLLGTAVLVLVTGHLGGTLIRGDGYLTHYLPNPIKQLVGLSTRPQGMIANIDSALVYQDLVAPVLERRCVKCHGSRKSEDDLRLDMPEHIRKGGDDGPVVVAGKPNESELLRRVTLPPYDEDVMPPEGETPLTIGETELIRWWIASGASFDVRVKEIDEVPTAVAVYLARLASPRDPRRQGIFALSIPPPDTSAVAQLRQKGFGVRVLLEEAPFIEITTTNVRSQLADETLPELQPLAQHITWLDLSSTGVTDEALAALATMKHLTRLHLQQTAITDDGLSHLSGLTRLEYLNLYGTAVSDAGLTHLSGLTGLRAVYLWQTNVTEEGIASLREKLPNVQVNAGSTLAEVQLPEVGEE